MGCCLSGKPLELPDVYFTEEWRTKLPRLDGKVVVITGCTTGTGFTTAMECARLGARVLLLNRSSERADNALAEVKRAAAYEDWYDASARQATTSNKVQPASEQKARAQPGPSPEHVDCDLMSLDSVRAAAKRVSELVGSAGLDVLVLNAGITAAPKGKEDTKDGFDAIVQTNHTSHMLLIHELMPCLEAASTRSEARICFHSSNGRVIAKKEIKKGKDDIKPVPLGPCKKNSTQEWKKDWKNESTYYLTKAYNFVCAMTLKDKLAAKGSKIKVLCAHPGFATTKAAFDGHGKCAIWIGGMMLKNKAQSASDGAMPLLTSVVAEDANSGDFYAPDGTVPLEAGMEQMKGMPVKMELAPFEKKLMKDWAEVFDATYKGLEIEF